jgi:hypothetical protein
MRPHALARAALLQPIAADDDRRRRRLPQGPFAVGKPTGTTIDITGRELIRMDDLVRQYLAAVARSSPGTLSVAPPPLSHQRPRREPIPNRERGPELERKNGRRPRLAVARP